MSNKIGENNKGSAGRGRPKGSPNKTTAQIKEAIGFFISQNSDKLNEWIEQVDDPAKRIDLYFKAMEYALPKLARSEVAVEESVKTINVYTWSDGEPSTDQGS